LGLNVIDVLVVLSSIIVVYFLIYHVLVLALLIMSYGEMSWIVRGRQPSRPLRHPWQHPGVSLIVPVFNEEELIVTTVSSLLDQEYAPLEIVVVDDGSTDSSFVRLQAAFDLVSVPVEPTMQLDTAPVKSIHVSRAAPSVVVVHKENGGRSDAVNAGFHFARHDLVAIADADGILEPDAIGIALRAFEEFPHDCVAVGGNIRVVNSSQVADGKVVDPHVGWRGLAATQTIEYLRGFLGTRIAWSQMNALLIVSGGFGIFRRDSVVAVGGFSTETIGEDMEITARLHHKLRPTWPQARIAFVHDAVCWTQAPDTGAGLRSQRIRWQVGLLETIGSHFGMAGRRAYGLAGVLALPYLTLFEAISPIFEVLGLVIVITLLILEPSTWPYFVALLFLSTLLGQVQSLMALLIEEVGFRRYGRAGMTRLLAWSLVEGLWFRPLIAVWRLAGTVMLLIGRRPGWGAIPRRALETPHP
jgi:cellulose synthase/poly-beta-1,6-N-acetylglucosamine synthase-like glycosyltransferase